MNFQDTLNNYFEILNCSSKDLADNSELDPSLISKYRNGQRTPKVDSEQLEKISLGLYKISLNKKMELNKNEILLNLSEAIRPNNINFETFRSNFNFLVNELNINITDFSKNTIYDASYISRIRNGLRKPYDINNFANSFAQYVVRMSKEKTVIAHILNVNADELDDLNTYKSLLSNWLYNNKSYAKNVINDFLQNIDTFDIEEYSSLFHSNTISIPSSPFTFQKSKNYYGIQEIKNAETEFIKTTLLSKSKEPLFMYSEMPMDDILEDPELQKKLILGMSMLLKKGIHLNIIHNVYRPLQEMILGIISWIPIYMTGSISPYYFDKIPPSPFSYMHCTSGQVALIGECSKNNENECKLCLTTKKDELKYYKKKSEILLQNAKPLMTILRSKDEFDIFMSKDDNQSNIKHIRKDIFKNIDFTINENRWIMINKNNTPELHFVIFNTKLRLALENFLVD